MKENLTTAASNTIKAVSDFFATLPEKIGYALGYAIGKVAKFGVDLYTFATTKIPEFISSVMNYMSELPGKIQTQLSSALSNVVNWGSNLISTGKSKVSSFLSNVTSFFAKLPGNVKSHLSSALSAVTSWGSNLVSKGKKAASNMVTSIVNTIKSLPSKMTSIGKELVQGLWNGITAMGNWLKNKINSFASGIINGFKKAFDIKSPSRVMKNMVGKYLPEGIAVGIDDNAKAVYQSIRDLANKAVNLSSDLLGNMNVPKLDLGTNMSNNQASGGQAVTQFTQIINAPKQPSRIELYRQTRNLLDLRGGF